MDGIRSLIQDVLGALRELSSVITRQLDSGNKDSFLHTASEFIQTAIATLEQIELTAKELNALLNVILSTAELIGQNLSWEGAYNAVFLVSREVGGLIDGSIPEDMAQSNEELQRLLDAASAKMTKIQASRDWLLKQVIEACQRNRCNSKTFRRLEAYRLKVAADIRDCEQTVSNAREIIEQLHKKAKEETVKNAGRLAVSATATCVLGFGAAAYFGTGATLGGSLLGCAGVGGAVICYNIAKKLGDWIVVWEEVEVKRNQYRQMSTRLESLKVTVEKEVTAAVQLTRPRAWKRHFCCLFTCCNRTVGTIDETYAPPTK